MGAELAPEKAEKFLDSPDYVSEVKISGERLTIVRVDKGVRIFTRSGSKFAPDRPIEVTHRWPQMQQLGWVDIPAGTVLDGEGWSPIRGEEEIAGLFNYRSVVPMPEDMRYICWDTVYWGDTSLEQESWLIRRKQTEKAIKFIGSALIECVVVCYENKRQFFDSIIAAGGEGVVLKHINSPYIQGKKPANLWVKAKKKDTFDCIVTGFKPGEGKYKNMVGSLELSQYKSMGVVGDVEEFKLFVVCYASGITDELRTQITANPEAYLDKIVTIDAYERVKGSVTLKQPRIKYFRPEGSKDPRDCKVE
jgi:DNA ligase-1